MKGRKKVIQDYKKATQDPKRPYKAIQDHNRSLKDMLSPTSPTTPKTHLTF